MPWLDAFDGFVNPRSITARSPSINSSVNSCSKLSEPRSAMCSGMRDDSPACSADPNAWLCRVSTSPHSWARFSRSITAEAARCLLGGQPAAATLGCLDLGRAGAGRALAGTAGPFSSWAAGVAVLTSRFVGRAAAVRALGRAAVFFLVDLLLCAGLWLGRSSSLSPFCVCGCLGGFLGTLLAWQPCVSWLWRVCGWPPLA